ncbi:hypothetical protein BKN38_04365 [Helicobacter sp. CLO-3]|uniref:hypothetical protein n=1 Tax=unclassified Helicobacter TaxID=2593540 RepID=UPI0008049EF1|nr:MULTISPECIES: hypothetical protein [unclassified Helicobacter]OBV29203.1 hypothetical protein BA723_01025 [Helicobacter sp. CLO-3]OHU84034.1 hypothetical protein BKN38_04365 [Helicobacter sp. CLO-3]
MAIQDMKDSLRAIIKDDSSYLSRAKWKNLEKFGRILDSARSLALDSMLDSARSAGLFLRFCALLL